MLDVDHTYNYKGRGPQDWISPVVALPHWTPGEGTEPVLQFTGHPEENAERTAPCSQRRKRKLFRARSSLKSSQSPLLTAFWGHPVSIKAWVVLPPGYSETEQRALSDRVLDTRLRRQLWNSFLAPGISLRDRMKDGKMPPMIWVMLDESCPQGTHEFADSVNNGPWGAALTTEFIPYLERKYRMDARTTGRFLNGHSSGGLGYASASGQLSEDFWRDLVHVARPERLPRLHGTGPVRCECQCLSEGGRLCVAAYSHERQGGRHD